jgi:argonaute-like protein implicated in RNA metabolism and viral defense
MDRLVNGADRFPGMGETFGVNLRIMEVMATNTTSEYVEACKKFVRRPDFQDADIFIAYTPEGEGKASYDSPYYEVKKFLIRNGIPSQMVDEETLANPRFKDLNIALNVFAKAGYTPWVLDEELKDADLFIGLSYSSIKRGEYIEKLMAYVNVFDKYGRWKFYQGDIEAFPYEDRHKHYKEIVRSSLAKYQAENPVEKVGKIHIHYAQKMSSADRRAIDTEVREILPGCQTYFVHINTTFPIRLFDLSTEDGSMQRRSYVVIDEKQFYMCTTGVNTLNQRGMGTPKILAVTVNTFQDKEPVSLQTIAQHILSLTRLNWASTRPFCHEPITIKFAGDISYFMTVFMNDPHFSVSERVKNKPWFL